MEEGVLAKNKVLAGYVKGDYYGYSEKSKLPVEIEVELRADKKERKYELSICGEIWSPRKADVIVAGQIDDTLKQIIKDNAFIFRVPKYCVEKLLRIWGEYHLNATKPVPAAEKEAYLNFVKKYIKKHGEYPPHNLIKEAFPDYGVRWYFWPIPRATLRWIIAKWLVNPGENAYTETDRILLEIDRLGVNNSEGKKAD